MALTHLTIPSPIGHLTLVALDDILTQVRWPDQPPLPPFTAPVSAVLTQAAAELAAYFAREAAAFAVPRQARGTPFQQAVWSALAQVPPGHAWTYRELGEAIGHPRAVRAVGAALKANPLAIIQPCHRVVGAGGKLTGFAGGLPAKRWLLDHEAGQRSLIEISLSGAR